MKVQEGLYYTKEHEWIQVFEDGKAHFGISDYAQEQMGDIVFVELPEEGDMFDEGETLCVVESVKAVSDVYMPLSGRVTGINEDLEDSPELLNEDAYGNWIVAIEDYEEKDLDALMSAEEYKEYLED